MGLIERFNNITKDLFVLYVYLCVCACMCVCIVLLSSLWVQLHPKAGQPHDEVGEVPRYSGNVVRKVVYPSPPA